MDRWLLPIDKFKDAQKTPAGNGQRNDRDYSAIFDDSERNGEWGWEGWIHIADGEPEKEYSP